MKKQTRRIVPGLCCTLLSLMSLSSHASNISNTPLFSSTFVEPNVFFVVDDSINMEMDQMNADLRAQGQYVIANRDYRFLTPVITSFGVASVLPSQQAVTAYNESVAADSEHGALHADANGVWRARSYKFNRIYYNPDVTYKAWDGANDANQTYASISDISQVPWDPYASNGTLVNLTTLVTWSSTVVDTLGQSVTVTTNDYYVPRYYDWVDSNGNGVVDAADAHTLIEIRSSGCSSGAQCPSQFTRALSRTDCATPGTCDVSEELRNFANWWTYHRTRDKVVKAALSSVIYLGQDIRMGMSTTHNNILSRYEIASMTSANKGSLLSRLFNYQGRSPGSPLKAALERAGNYFACSGSVDSNANHFSYFPANASDESISLSGNLFGNNNCPIENDAATHKGRCQQNFAIMISDGFNSNHGELQTWNGQPSAPGDADWSGVVAGQANNVRLYNDPFGGDTRNVDADASNRFAGPPYGDVYNDTLADVAMHFYMNDLSSTLSNDVPTQTGVDENSAQHMVTFGVALGQNGTLSDNDNPKAPGFSWPDPNSGNAQKIDDLRHAAYNGRGKFFSAANSSELSSALSSSVKSVSERTGSAAAVAFNTTTLDTDTSLYLALFNSSRWSGDLVSYDLNPNTGVIQVDANWHAATLLDATAPSSRKIYTWDGTSGVNMNMFSSLSPAQQADLNTGPSGVADGLGAYRLAYLRGARSNENAGHYFRIRDTVLGDIVHAGPVFVGAPNLSWPDVAPFPIDADAYSYYREANAARQGTIYVGANDGSMHAFNAQTGIERFAYIPNMLFSTSVNQGLHYLTDPSYTHKYYVDQAPTVSDIFVNSAWKTVLVGAMGAGGRGIYVLDITDPTTFSTSNVLAEFTKVEDANIGYSFSKPVVALTNALDANGRNRFAAIFGNGYNSGGTGRPALFVVFLDFDASNGWQKGSAATDDYIRIDVPANSVYGDTTTPNGLATPAVIDVDGNGTADRVYAGDLKGNLWAFNLGSWQVAHATGNGTKVPLFNNDADQTLNQVAITVRPSVIAHPTEDNAYIVLFGSGSYFENNDASDNRKGAFYGIYDKSTFTSTLTNADLTSQTLSAPAIDKDYRIVSSNNVALNKHGWRIPLTAYERVVTNPLVRGDIVYFNTTVPTSDVCDTGGNGWLFAVNTLNGGEPVVPVFDYNHDEIVDLSDKVENGSHTPAGSVFDQGLPAASTILGDRRYTVGSQSGSGGDVKTDVVEHLGGPGTGRLSWEQKFRPF